jgi:hypothetical protein
MPGDTKLAVDDADEQFAPGLDGHPERLACINDLSGPATRPYDVLHSSVFR